jgi:hypothetical protein
VAVAPRYRRGRGEGIVDCFFGRFHGGEEKRAIWLFGSNESGRGAWSPVRLFWVEKAMTKSPEPLLA